jgi:NADH dehydrogenase
VAAAHGMEGGRGAGPREVDDIGNRHLIDAARVAGADVVLLSVAFAAADSPLDLFRAKYAAETHLRGSASSATVVRATAFTETWCEIIRATRGTGRRPVVFGHGDNPISFVSIGDAAALVACAVIDRSLRGETLTISGPGAVSMNDLASMLQNADGLSQPPRHVPRAALRALATATRPLAPVTARRARASLVMDTTSQVYDSSELRARLHDMPSTPVEAVVVATSTHDSTSTGSA